VGKTTRFSSKGSNCTAKNPVKDQIWDSCRASQEPLGVMLAAHPSPKRCDLTQKEK